MPFRRCTSGASSPRYPVLRSGCLTMRLTLGAVLFGLPAIEFKDAPALHLRIEPFPGRRSAVSRSSRQPGGGGSKKNSGSTPCTTQEQNVRAAHARSAPQLKESVRHVRKTGNRALGRHVQHRAAKNFCSKCVKAAFWVCLTASIAGSVEANPHVELRMQRLELRPCHIPMAELARFTEEAERQITAE